MKQNTTRPDFDFTHSYRNESLHDGKKSELGFDVKNMPGSLAMVLFSLENELLTIDYTNKVFDKLIGHDFNKLSDTGKENLARIININDLRIISEKIIPATLKHLKQTPVSQHQDFCFSFNYRVSAPDNQHKNILQHIFFYQSDTDANSFKGVGYITDITYFKDDCKIIFTLEKNKTTATCITQELIFRNIYLPDESSKLLTKREIEILNDIYNGLSSKEIANKLCLSLNTVNNHRKNITAKTHTKNTSELIHYALKNGLL